MHPEIEEKINKIRNDILEEAAIKLDDLRLGMGIVRTGLNEGRKIGLLDGAEAIRKLKKYNIQT